MSVNIVTTDEDIRIIYNITYNANQETEMKSLQTAAYTDLLWQP